MERAAAAVERQIERRADLGRRRDRSEVWRQHTRVTIGPHQDGAAGAQIGEVDPGRAARQPVDQHPRLRALRGE